MNNVENRVVEMKFDNAQFEQAVAQTMDTLDKFKEKLNFDDAGKGIEKVGGIAGNFSGILGSIGSAIDSVADHFSNLSGVGERVFNALTSAATGFITSGINKLVGDVVQGGQSRAMNLEQAKFQLQGILGNAEEVNRVIYDDILPELQGTPFSLDQAAVVMGQLAASGKTASEEVRQGTRAIAGAAAMTNSSFADMGRIFTKVAGNGRVMGDTLQEMSSRGLNAAADMGKVFGMTEAEVREAVTAGEISYDMFAEAMDQLYGEQAQKSTTMYTGALEDLRAALARIGAEPQAVKLEFLRDAFNALVPAVDAVNAVLKPLWNSAHDVETVMKDGEEVQQYAKAFRGPVAQSIQQAGWAFQSMFVKLDENHDIMRYTSKNLEELGYEFEEAEDGTRSYYEVLEDGSKVYHDVGEAMMNHDMLRILTSSAHAAVNVGTALIKVFKAIGEGFLNAFPKLGLKNIANLVDGVEKFTQALILSDETLTNIKYITQAVFTPLGLLVRIFMTAAKVLVEFGKIVYHALAPTFKVITSMAGVAGAVFSGLGKAVDNAAADITGLAQKLYESTKSFAKFLGLDKLVGKLKSGLEKLSTIFGKVSFHSYQFLSNLSENAKKAGAAIKNKLRLDEFAQKLKMIKDRLKATLAGVGGYLGFDKIIEVFRRLKETIQNLFSTTFSLDRITGSISDFGNKILDMIPTDQMLAALDKFANFMTKLVYSIASFVSPRINAAVEFFERLWRSIKRLFTALQISSKMIGVLNTLKLAFWSLTKIIPRLFGFKSFGDILDTLKNKLKTFIAVFKEFASNVISGITGDTKRFGNNIKTGFNNLVDDKITKKIKSFSDVMRSFGDIIKNLGSGIGKKLRDFYSALEEGDKKKILATLSMLVIALGYIKTIGKIGKTAKSAYTVIQVFKKFGEGINGIANAFTGVAKAIKRITYLIGVTSALLIFAVTLSILGRMDMDTLVQGGIAAIGSLIALSVSLALLNKVAARTEGGVKNILKLGAAMAAVGAAIFLMSKSIVNLAVVYKSMSKTDYAIVVATLAGMLVAFGVLAKTFSKMDKMEVGLKSAGIAMLAISTAIKMMVGSMQAIGSMDTASLVKGGGAIVILLGLMTTLAYFAGKNDNVAKAATAMATLTASLLVLRIALGLFASLDLGTYVHGLIFMAGALFTLLGIMSLFKAVAGPKEAGGIIAVALAAGILAGALLALSLIPFGSLIKSFAGLIIVFVALAGVMAIFSAIGVGMLVVAGAFALLGVSLLFIGAGALALVAALSALIPLIMLLSTVPEELVNGGLSILATIASGLKDIFFDLAKGVLAFGGALLVAGIAALLLGAGVVVIGIGLATIGVGLLFLAGGIATLAVTLQAIFGGEFLSSIGEGLKNFAQIAMEGLSGVVDRIKGIFNKDEGKKITKEFTDGATEAVDGSSGDLTTAWDGVMTDMKNSAGDKKAELSGVMSDVMNSNTDGVEAGLPGLEDAFGGGLGNLESIADVKSDKISDTIGSIPGDAGSLIRDNKGKYSSALSSMLTDGNKDAKKATKENKKIAKDNAQAYTKELSSNESKKAASNATKELDASAKKSFKNIKSDYTTLGKNAGEGFKGGIRSKVNEVADESARMVREAIKAAKREEDAHSPSKVFAEIGRWAGEGYILGMKTLSGQVAKAATDMVGGGIDAVTDAMSYIATVSDMKFDFDPTITPVVDLTNIDQSVSQMGSMFNSPFGITADFGMNSAALAARAFTDAQNQSDRLDALNKLANNIGSMTESMNSRALNVYNTIDGSSDPEAFADGLIRSFRLNARTL